MPFLIMNFFVLIAGCSIIEPDGGDSRNSDQISITSEGTSSTEAWLKIKAGELGPLKVIHIKRDGSLMTSFRLYGQDTLIYDDSLLPCRSYSYSASLSSERFSFSSEEVEIRTMDTTSHDFHFRMFVVCNQSSYLSDVAIINENDIWAVGRMYMNLPEGKDDYEPVGAVHWDGREWKQVKIPAILPQNIPGFLTPQDIIAFSPSDIWLADGGIIHYDGKKVIKCYWIADFPGNTKKPILENGITKLWGTSSENLYAAGYKGALAHFDGKSWHKIETNTDLDIQSVWGSTDPLTGEEIVLCVASDKDHGAGRKVLQIKNDKAFSLTDHGLPLSLSSVWFSEKNKIYLTGDGIFTLTNGFNTASWDNKYDAVTMYYTHSIAGNKDNDIAVAGSFGDICHFNGKTWRNYLGREVEKFYGNLWSIDMKGNTICAVGISGNLAYVVLGYR